MGQLEYVNIKPEWADDLERIEFACFPSVDTDDRYDAAELHQLACDFPKGCVVVLDGDAPVAMGLGIRVHFDFSCVQHSIHDIVGADGASGHVDDGPWYYGTALAVLPAYRRRGIGSRLYDMRKEICSDLNLAGIVAGGAIPGYANHKHAMTAATYVDKVNKGELYDTTLTMQIANGFDVRDVIANYFIDPHVDNWASFIVWDNPNYSP